MGVYLTIPMKRTHVQSSSVRSIGYDARRALLEVEFRSGAVYQYEQVPEAVFRLLRTAPSVGTFVNRVVKPRFDARRIVPQRLAPHRIVPRGL